MVYKKTILKILKTFLFKHQRAVFLLAALLLFLFFPLEKPLVRDDYSRIILDSEGGIMRVFLTRDQQYCLPPDFCDTLPEKLVDAVIRFEDKYFYYHPGINPVSVIRATIQNLKAKKVISGASTITMQVARIRKNRSRNTFNKIIEMSEAVRIEAHLSKKEILMEYLNHAPYGGNIIGFQAATWRYFGKPPEELSWAEACLLAVLPNSPATISPIKNNEELFTKRNRLLKSLFDNSDIDSLTYFNSVDEPMPHELIPFDLSAPHLTRRIDEELTADLKIVYTSIDPVMQNRANELVKRYNHMLEHYGIKNISAIIVENKTHRIKAYIGSQDFYGTAGKVDGVTAPRSSGSTLKPFLYALAIHDGLIIPQSLLQDIPTYYGVYAPSNANESYGGIVTAHDALVRSLNVPAVRLLYSYGHYKFYNFLKTAGVSTLFRSADSYGLPLIIGGAEVTLEDMAMLYSGLANLGNFSPVSYLNNPPTDYPAYLIDTLSCVLILDNLKDLQRPGSEYYWTKFNNQKPVAWKTGTSYGHKDAWSIGVNSNYTVGVWVGNFDATTNKNLSGAGSAGPLMFDLFNALENPGPDSWWHPEDYNYETTEVCAVTGYAATEHCRDKISVLVPKSDLLKKCPYHISALVDSAEKYCVCSACWEEGYHKMQFLAYPPLVTEYMRKNGAVIERVPPHNPYCPVAKNNELLVIDYPKPNTHILTARDFNGEYQPIVFSAAHQLEGQTIFWYIDDQYLGMTVHNHKISCFSEPGDHVLTIVDAFGNSSHTEFSVSKN